MSSSQTKLAPARTRSRLRLSLECLEERRFLAFNPTALEQEMLEHVNRMRMDPQGELAILFSDLETLQSDDAQVEAAVDFFNVDTQLLQEEWAKLEPTAPLAWNESLYDAARAHSQQMIAFDQQSHNLPGEADLLSRIVDAGYDWEQSVGVGENVFAFAQSVFYGHAGFAIDWGLNEGGLQDPAGHRLNIMDGSFQEIGIGILADDSSQTEVGPLVITQDFGRRGNHQATMLGVVFSDLNGSGHYEAGEGVSNVSIELTGSNGSFTTSTMTAGGYQLQAPAGTYAVRAMGGTLSGAWDLGTITIAADNVKLDLNTLGIASTHSITGQVVDAAAANLDSAVADSGVESVTVYLDGNANGQLDLAEPVAHSDQDGLFRFDGLPAGDYTLRAIAPLGWSLTGSDGRTVTVSGGPSASVEIALARRFEITDDQVTFLGTSSADIMELDVRHGVDPSLMLNGEAIVAAGVFSTIRVEAGSGVDTIEIVGSDAGETARLFPGWGRVEFSSAVAIIDSTESITVRDSTGYDRVYFYDSGGDDQFLASPQVARLSGEGFNNAFNGADRSYAFAAAGGTDEAHLYDSPGRDFFASSPSYGRLSGDDFYLYAGGFGSVHAYATGGGHDRAFLHDSAGDDVFIATSTNGRLVGEGFDSNAHSFDRVYALANAGGRDIGHLYDTAENDYFVGNESYARLSGAVYYNQAENFQQVFGYASGGFDRAFLYGSAQGNLLTAQEMVVRMQGGEIDHQISAFDRVYGFGGDGLDTAEFYGLGSNALLVASGADANLFAGNRDQRAKGFELVRATAEAGSPTLSLSAIDYVLQRIGW